MHREQYWSSVDDDDDDGVIEMSPVQKMPWVQPQPQVRMRDMDLTKWAREQWSSSSSADDDHDDEVIEALPPVRKKPRVQPWPQQSNEGTRVGFPKNFIDGPGPLGLRLRKSASLLDLIQKVLTQAAKVKGKQSTCSAVNTGSSDTNSTTREGIRASHFSASLLRIGTWEWRSHYYGDLLAKFYYAKSMLVWEVLHEGLKSKIEIKFSKISALKITCPRGLHGTMEIALSGKPKFYRETNPRPLRSTTWLLTADFTGGQASTQRHVLQCAPGIMDIHIEKLLSQDHRLHLLSRQNITNPESLCLAPRLSVSEVPKCSNSQDLSRTDNGYQFGTPQLGHSFPPHFMSTATITGGKNHSGAPHGIATIHFQSSVVTSAIAEKTTWGHELKSNQGKEFFQVPRCTQPFMSNGGIMDSIGNNINSQINPWNSHGGVDYSSSRMVLPNETMKFPCVKYPWNQQKISNNQDQSLFPPHSISTATNAGGINHYGAPHGMPIHFPSSVAGTSMTTEEPSWGHELNSDHWKKFLQAPHGKKPFMSHENGIINANKVQNQINPWNSQDGVDCSSSRVVLPKEAMKFPQVKHPWNSHGNVNCSSSRMVLPKETIKFPQVKYPCNLPSYTGVSLSGKMAEPVLPQYIVDPGNPPPSNGNTSSEFIELEDICQKLLSDDGDEVANVTNDQERLIGTVNSLSCLLGQAPSSQSTLVNTIHVAPPPGVEETPVLHVTCSGDGDGGGDNSLLPSTQMPSMPWEALADIDMDMGYLSELLPFIP